MQQLFADMTSRDPVRVYRALWALLRLREPDELDALAAALPEIEAATDGVELGGTLRSNRETLEFALRRLRYHRAGAGCLCALYPEVLIYDPEQEAEAGNVRIVERREAEGSSRCACSGCGRAFRVQYGEAHAGWWEWTPA